TGSRPPRQWPCSASRNGRRQKPSANWRNVQGPVGSTMWPVSATSGRGLPLGSRAPPMSPIPISRLCAWYVPVGSRSRRAETIRHSSELRRRHSDCRSPDPDLQCLQLLHDLADAALPVTEEHAGSVVVEQLVVDAGEEIGRASCRERV